MWESLAKDSHIFSTKSNSVLDYVVGIYLTSWRLNNVVKLTMLWTTGPIVFARGKPQIFDFDISSFNVIDGWIVL